MIEIDYFKYRFTLKQKEDFIKNKNILEKFKIDIVLDKLFLKIPYRKRIYTPINRDEYNKVKYYKGGAKKYGDNYYKLIKIDLLTLGSRDNIIEIILNITKLYQMENIGFKTQDDYLMTEREMILDSLTDLYISGYEDETILTKAKFRNIKKYEVCDIKNYSIKDDFIQPKRYNKKYKDTIEYKLQKIRGNWCYVDQECCFEYCNNNYAIEDKKYYPDENEWNKFSYILVGNDGKYYDENLEIVNNIIKI